MASVESLMIKFRVSPAACNAKISDIHILEISQKYCSKWRDLPTPLGLNKMAANDLAYAPGDEGGKRKQFLERWQQEKGSDATYRALITALLNVNSRDEAESVCMLLQDTGTPGTAAVSPQVPATGVAPPATGNQPQDETAAAFQHYACSLSPTAASYLDKTLDWETKGVDKHISEISNVAMIDWEEKLAPVMGLTDVEINDLRRNTTGGAVLLRRAVLKKWKQKAAFRATYRNLLTLCCEAKDFTTAQAIIDVLNKKAGGAAPAPATTPAPIQPAAVTPQPAAPTPKAAEPTPKPAEGKPTLLELCNDLKPLADQWKFIGDLLELKADDMKDVVAQEDTLGSTKCLMKVLKIWMERGNPPVSWDTIKGIKEFL